jgi:hypothetical protein
MGQELFPRQDRERELLEMQNGFQPYRRRGIRFFPHIVPIAFPLIFPLGFGLAAWLFHAILPVLGVLILVGVILFIVRLVQLGSPEAAWNSMRGTGTQWQQRFTAQRQQPPYYQPQQPTPQAGQEQPAQPYGQGYGQQPYYQPSAQARQEQPYYRPTPQATGYEQPQAHYPEQTPPMQQ